MPKRPVYLILGLVLLAGVLVAVFRREREPEYAGKKLSEWVESYGILHAMLPPNLPSSEEAADAIRHIGTNALPYLLKWTRYETPRWGTRLNSILERINPRLMVSVKQTPPAESAALAFIVLGPKAEKAIPDLARMLMDPKADRSATRVANLLFNLGKAGLSPLLQRLTNQPADPGLRMAVVYHVGCFGTNARPAFPIVRRFLTDSDRRVRIVATNALWMIDREQMENVVKNGL